MELEEVAHFFGDYQMQNVDVLFMDREDAVVESVVVGVKYQAVEAVR